jgi:hypothetical protein
MTENPNDIITMDEVIVRFAKELTGAEIELSDKYRAVINEAADLFMSNPAVYNIFHRIIVDSINGDLPYTHITVQ